MATSNKDFKVKNGLIVTDGGTFGGTVTVATPTQNTHATTKQYVDTLVSNIKVPTGIEFPSSPSQGQLFFDEITEHLFVYYETTWNSIALVTDTLDIPQHIHDTAIDGTGLVVSIFKDAGYYNEPGDYTDAGFYSTNAWETTWDGGISIDNFN